MHSNERKLKIVPKFFPRAYDKYVRFPEIRIAGKWLQDLGFLCGNYVAITCSENAITITMLPEANVQPVREAKRRETPVFSPELDALPGDQVFQQWAAEDYYEWVAKRKTKQKKKFSPPEGALLDELIPLRPLIKPLGQPTEEGQLIQLHPEADHVAAPDDQIITLHPEPRHVADGPNFDTIA